MCLLILRVVFAIGIFILTIFSGILPLKIVKYDSKLLNLCDVFSSGIFLSTALLHTLPDAVSKFNEFSNIHYPLPYLVCIITFIIFVISEKLLFNHHISSDNDKNRKIATPFFLIILLGFHSLIEGAAIGSNANIFEAIAVFIAVFAHKGSESFALSVNLRRSNVSENGIKNIITLYSIITPLGLFIASYITFMTNTNTGGITAAYFNAITSGTFLYLGTEHLIGCSTCSDKHKETTALLCGIFLMALVAIWV